MPKAGENRRRLPTGSLPIDETEWSGDHGRIKGGIDAMAAGNVFIDRDSNVWLENPDGTFTSYGPAASYTGAGTPKGRHGKNRNRRRR